MSKHAAVGLELLKEIRREKHITYAQMSEKLGYESKSAYWNLENGVRKIDTENANRIAAILEMTPQQKLDVFLPD